MTDGSKAVVWDAVYRPFGEAHAISGSASLNLRFPGQYFLRSTGCTTTGTARLKWGPMPVRSTGNESSDHSAAAATVARGQDGLGIGCHHLAMPRSCAITFAAL